MFKNIDIFSLMIVCLHRRLRSPKVPGDKVNEEGPDLFGWDGHSERLFSATGAAVVWMKKNTREQGV